MSFKDSSRGRPGGRLRQRGAVAIMVAFGVYSYVTIPIDAFPDVSNTQVEIVSNASGLSALEIERFVTFPIEMSMRGLPDVVQMRSITKFGLSVVTIVFEWEFFTYIKKIAAGSLWFMWQFRSVATPRRQRNEIVLARSRQ